MSSPGIFVGFEKTIMGGFDTVLNGVTTVYGGWMASIFVSCFTGYFIWRGYQTLAGKLQMPLEETLWDAAKMIIIMMFVTNSNGYLDIVEMGIMGFRDGVTGDESIWALLDTVWAKAQALGTTLYNLDESIFFNGEGFLAQLIVWGGVGFLVLISAFVNLIAELILLLMLKTAPIFIFCLMWGWFRPTFNNWLKTILSCILTAFFSGLALQIIINYVNDILVLATKNAAVANMVTMGFQVGVAALLAGGIMFVIYHLSNALAGAGAEAAMQSSALRNLMPSPPRPSNNSSRDKMRNSNNQNINSRMNPSTNAKNTSGEKSSSQQASDARKASIQTMQRINAQRK